MLRAILRHVQFGLIASATLLVVLAFQRLQLYSVPVLVGHIVHPSGPAGGGGGGAGIDSFDATNPGGDGGSRELVGHGHAHGRHRIFSTNVIEVGLFKFIVPFRWSTSDVDDVEEEAITLKRLQQYKGRDGPRPSKKQQGEQEARKIRGGRRRKSTKHSDDERAERNVDGFAGRRNRPRIPPRSPPDDTAVIAPGLGQNSASVIPPQLRSTIGNGGSKEELPVEAGNRPGDKAVSVMKPDDSPSYNATVTDRDGANITALPARRLTRSRSRQRGVVESMWNRWRNG